MNRGVLVLTAIVVVSLSLTVYLMYYNDTSLSGVVIFDADPEQEFVSPESLRVFLIRASIGPPLDSLYIQYARNVGALEDSVVNMRSELQIIESRINEEEVLLRTLFGDIPSTDVRFRENREVIDSLQSQYDTIEKMYDVKRDRLIFLQSEYNSIIAQLIDTKILLEDVVDAEGNFDFPRVPRGDYYVYSMRVLAGDRDVTNEPIGTYYMHALTARQIRKYSWMQKVSVGRNSYIRLDSSNMTEVFK